MPKGRKCLTVRKKRNLKCPFVKFGVNNKQQKHIKIAEGNKTTTVLIIKSNSFNSDSWTFPYCSPNVSLTELIVTGSLDLIVQLKKLNQEGKSFGSIVLGADHGIQGLPWSQWGFDKKKQKQDLLHHNTEMIHAFKVTRNIHYCSCSRSPYI